MPGAGCPKPPLGEELPFFVHYDLDIPLAANINNPLVGGLAGRVGNRDAADFGMFGRYRDKVIERLLGNCVQNQFLRKQHNRELDTHKGSRSDVGKRSE